LKDNFNKVEKSKRRGSCTLASCRGGSDIPLTTIGIASSLQPRRRRPKGVVELTRGHQKWTTATIMDACAKREGGEETYIQSPIRQT